MRAKLAPNVGSAARHGRAPGPRQQTRQPVLNAPLADRPPAAHVSGLARLEAPAVRSTDRMLRSPKS